MKRSTFAVAALAAVLLLCLPAVAPAQEGSGELPALRVGLLEVHPYLALSETWRDNVFATPENEQDDYLTTITPGIGLKLPFRAHQLTFDARADIARYADFTELDTESYQAGLKGDFAVGDRVTIRVGDTFARAYESLLESPTGTNDRYDTNNATLTATYAFVDVAKLQLSGGLMTLSYENDQDLRSRAEATAAAALMYRVLPVTQALVEYDFKNVAYEEDAADELDSVSHSGQVGAIWEFSPVSKGIAKVGYEGKNFSGKAIDDYDTWVASLELNHVLAQRAQVAVIGSRVVNEAKYVGPSYYTTTGIGGTLTIWFLDRLSGTARLSFGEDKFSAPIAGDTEVRKDQTSRAGLGAHYQFNNWLSFEAEYAYVNRDSNIGAYSATENSVSLRVKAAL